MRATPCSTCGTRGCVPSSATWSSGSTTTRWSRSCSICCDSPGWTLGLAESVTGGLLGARLTGIAGASDVFRGSIVSYATEVKQTVLGVPAGPVVSEAAALAMAHGARRVLGSDVALAVTGVAGPTEQDGMPVGTLCVGLVWPNGELTRTFRLPGQREQMRQFSVINALDLLRRTLGVATASSGRTFTLRQEVSSTKRHLLTVTCRPRWTRHRGCHRGSACERCRPAPIVLGTVVVGAALFLDLAVLDVARPIARRRHVVAGGHRTADDGADHARHLGDAGAGHRRAISRSLTTSVAGSDVARQHRARRRQHDADPARRPGNGSARCTCGCRGCDDADGSDRGDARHLRHPSSR